jgi:DNA modification methylase
MIFWGGNYYADRLPASSAWLVWDKDNGQSFFADGEIAWTNQKTAVRIFKHQWNGLIKASERGEKRVHPTQKPVALAEWCFEHYSEKEDKVLDLFGGSGSTLIACEKTGRKCYMMELSPAYCDVIVSRWEQATGKKAVLSAG